jgi:2-polyprenyl-6-methoxyphenol hydroxylase-like FAD-dependent oxidoreductase
MGADHSTETRPTAVIVGASLAGLMTALALSRMGMQVTLLERSDDTGRTGAALHVPYDLIARVTGEHTAPDDEVPAGIQSWTTVHNRLLAAATSDPRIHLHTNTSAVSVGQNPRGAWVSTQDGATHRGDLVIGADGHRSIVRSGVAPQHPDASFAGYVIWIGVAPESAIKTSHGWPGGTTFRSSGHDHLLGYSLPGTDGSTARGTRQLGWAWYDASRNDLLRKAGSVRGNIVHHSLTGPNIPRATLADLAAQARRQWDGPWLEAILDCIARGSVIGTPIAEYIPDHLVNGRLALVGDAAHVPTPMTGNGFSASLEDAEALADALTGATTDDIDNALSNYEMSRLREVRDLVRSGQDFSRSFSRERAHA